MSNNGNGSILENVVLGLVTWVNEADDKDRQQRLTGRKNCFVTLGGAVKVFVPSTLAASLPGVGTIVAFQIKRSQSGKMAVVEAWSWVDLADSGPLASSKDEKKFSFNWNYIASEQSVPVQGLTR